MGRPDKKNSYNTLDETDRCGQGVLTSLNADTIDIGVEDIDGAFHSLVGEVEYLVKACVEEEAKVEYKHRDHGNHQSRKDDIPDDLHPVRSVNFSCLIQGGRDSKDSSIEDYGIPTHAPPCLADHQDPTDLLPVGHEVNSIHAKEGHDLVNPTSEGEAADPDACNDNPREKVRKIRDDLHVLAKPEGAHLVEHEGEYDEGWKQQDILHETDDKGIAKYLLEAGTAEYYPEVLQPYERPGPSGPELEKGEAHVDDGQHSEQNEKYERRKQQQVQDLLALDSLPICFFPGL